MLKVLQEVVLSNAQVWFFSLTNIVMSFFVCVMGLINDFEEGGRLEVAYCMGLRFLVLEN